MSNKLANFSFVGELPTYKSPRQCFGYLQLSTLYHVLTNLLIFKLLLLLLFAFLPTFKIQRSWFLTVSETLQLAISLVVIFWIFLILLSFAGHYHDNRFLQIPLAILEACFCIFAIVGCTILVYNLTLTLEEKIEAKKEKIKDADDKQEQLMYRLAVLFMLLIFHGYYLYVLCSVYKDMKARKETDEFIARQQMFDEVCEEMAWEEEEAEKYKGLPMSGNYFPDSSYTDESSCNIYEDIGWLPERRCVTFFDGSP